MNYAVHVHVQCIYIKYKNESSTTFKHIATCVAAD